MKKCCALIILLSAVCLTFGCSATEGEPSQTPDLILRYAENQSAGYPTTQAAYAFADMVNTRTEGRVKIIVYSDSALGSENSVIAQMIYGGIDLSRVSVSQLSEYQPGLKVLQLPFLYDDAAQMWHVLESKLGDKFLDSLSVIGLTGLSWYEAGVRSFYSREKIENFEDLAGLRIRVQESSFMSDMINLFGGEPVQLAFSQVYMALRMGDIDAAENNRPSYVSQKHYEVAPYVLLDRHSRIPEIQLISRNALEELAALDPEYPDIIKECAKESSLIERSLWAEEDNEAKEALADAGVIITEPDEEELDKFRDAVMPLYDNYDGMPILKNVHHHS